jgi:hypothetical protein
MKLLILNCILLTSLVTNCIGQNGSLSNKSSSWAEVKDWAQASVVIVDDVWANIKQQIISQVGEDGYNEIRSHYDYKSIPPQMSVYGGGKKKDLKELSAKLSSLKVYKVASYDHIFQGKDWGKYIILKCPYEENKNWDTTAKWYVVYFILKSDYVL